MVNIKDNDKIDDKVNDDANYNVELSERDFYPPKDDRLHVSCVDDICGGDNFNDYAVLFWEAYEDEIYS